MSVFSDGQKVRAVGSYVYRLTEGRVYTVVRSHPREVTPTFTFPEYVTVVDDLGKCSSYHTHRFTPVD